MSKEGVSNTIEPVKLTVRLVELLMAVQGTILKIKLDSTDSLLQVNSLKFNSKPPDIESRRSYN